MLHQGLFSPARCRDHGSRSGVGAVARAEPRAQSASKAEGLRCWQAANSADLVAAEEQPRCQREVRVLPPIAATPQHGRRKGLAVPSSTYCSYLTSLLPKEPLTSASTGCGEKASARLVQALKQRWVMIPVISRARPALSELPG